MIPPRPALPLLAALLLAVGCAQQVAVQPNFPEPVTSKLPARVALFLSPELKTQVHEETLPSGGEWSLRIGPASAAFFEQLSRGLFEAVDVVDTPGAASGVDAVLEPVVDEFQFSTPDENFTNYYEAWFRFRMRVFAPDGRQVADWPFTGYGRSESRILGGDEAMDEAIRLAMRDAAAGVLRKLPEQPGVRELLSGRR